MKRWNPKQGAIALLAVAAVIFALVSITGTSGGGVNNVEIVTTNRSQETPATPTQTAAIADKIAEAESFTPETAFRYDVPGGFVITVLNDVNLRPSPARESGVSFGPLPAGTKFKVTYIYSSVRLAESCFAWIGIPTDGLDESGRTALFPDGALDELVWVSQASLPEKYLDIIFGEGLTEREVDLTADMAVKYVNYK